MDKLPNNKPPPLHPEDTGAPEHPGRRPASMIPRFLAFAMDATLVAAFGILLLTRILLPIHHAEGMHKFQEMLSYYAQQSQQAAEEGTPGPALPDLREHEAIAQMFAFAQTTLLMLFWAYFFFSEWLLKGSTLGKKTFALRAVNAATGSPPTLFESLLRSAFKSLTMVGHPILIVNFVVACFNRERRAGHDFLARTLVTAAGIEPATADSRSEP